MPLKFLYKGARRVYRGARKLGKKVPKEVWVAGASFFALGVGTAGFSAFEGVSTTGEFFGAVGRTTLAGAQGLGGTLGLTGGVSDNLAASIGNQELAGATVGSRWGGGTGRVASNVLGENPEITANGKDNRSGSSMAWAAIAAGAQYWLQSREYKKAEERQNRVNFFGDRMRGGDPNLRINMPSISDQSTVLGTQYDPDNIFSDLDSTRDLFDDLERPKGLFGGYV